MLRIDDADIEDKDLARELAEANRLLEAIGLGPLGIEAEEYDLEPDSRPALTASSPLWIHIPRGDSIRIEAQHALSFIADGNGTWDTERGELRARTSTYFYVRAEAPGVAEELLNGAPELDAWEDFFDATIEVDGEEFTASLVIGPTPVALAVTIARQYDKHAPPWLPGEAYVWIEHDKRASGDLVAAIRDAFLFELSATVGVDLVPSGRPYFVYDGGDATPFEEIVGRGETLRPLLVGPGLPEAQSLFVQANATHHPVHRILGYAKVLEHVGVTVTKLEGYEQLRVKLASPHALQPDARYLGELKALIERQREWNEDKRAMDLTIRRCCDAYELKRHAPACCVALQKLPDDASEKVRADALSDFADRLTATRNFLSHAKANYIARGNECPPGEYEPFAQIVRAAAISAIRWYAASDPTLRASRQ